MKLFVAVIYSTIAFLALASVATGGNPSLCARDGWTSAQSSSGQSFTSIQDCAKAREVFQPTASISPTAVGADEQFRLNATGFHANASVVVYFAITGQAPYGTYVPFNPTSADGTFTIPFVFLTCGNSPDDLTLTLVDSYGVHASARMTLC